MSKIKPLQDCTSSREVVIHCADHWYKQKPTSTFKRNLCDEFGNFPIHIVKIAVNHMVRLEKFFPEVPEWHEMLVNLKEEAMRKQAQEAPKRSVVQEKLGKLADTGESVKRLQSQDISRQEHIDNLNEAGEADMATLYMNHCIKMGFDLSKKPLDWMKGKEYDIKSKKWVRKER